MRARAHLKRAQRVARQVQSLELHVRVQAVPERADLVAREIQLVQANQCFEAFNPLHMANYFLLESSRVVFNK